MANEKHIRILRKGSEVWNQWRKKNPESRPDLSKADLRMGKPQRGASQWGGSQRGGSLARVPRGSSGERPVKRMPGLRVLLETL